MNVNLRQLDRREFCMRTGGALAFLALGSACQGISLGFPNDGRLSARSRADVKTSGSGKIMLGLKSDRDAVLQIPKNAGQSPVPLLVMLHGATQDADDMFRYLGSTPEETGVAVLAPNSRGTTWDAIRNTFADDVSDLNRALERTFEKLAVDPARVALGGFSDGATYAISLGLINGDLFNSVVAFSPGFVISGEAHGKPRFFISHGTHDHILPIDGCGRRIAAGLEAKGYEVSFREFDGDHEIPAGMAREGLQWIANGR